MMHSSLQSPHTLPPFRRALTALETRSTDSPGLLKSHSADKPSSTEHFSSHTPSPNASENLPPTLPLFPTDLAHNTFRDEPTTPTKSTRKLTFPSTYLINLQGQHSELDPTKALKSSSVALYSQENSPPDKSHHENLINSSVPRKLVDKTDQNDTSQFTDPFVSEPSILSWPTSGQSEIQITRLMTSSKSLNSAVSTPKTFARKFSAGFLRHRSSKDRVLVSEPTDAPVVSFGSKSTPHRARFNFISNIARNGEEAASREDLKCAMLPSKLATNTQSSVSSSPEMVTDVPFPESRSDGHDFPSHLNGCDPRLSSRVPLGTDKRSEAPLEGSSRQKRRTFSDAVRAPKTLAKNLTKNFPTTSRQDITESILEADRLDQVAKTGTVLCVELEFRHIDFNSKTGLSAQPTNPGRRNSPPPPLKILPIATNIQAPSSVSPTLVTPFHKPTMFSQRYDSFSSLSASPLASPAANAKLVSSCGGVHADLDPLKAVTGEKTGESSPFPFTPPISASQSTPGKTPPQSPFFEFPTTPGRKIQFPCRKIETAITEFSEKSGYHPQYRPDCTRPRPKMSSLRMTPQLAMHAPDLTRPSAPTTPTRKANRGPGAEMFATLSALQELCRDAQAFSDEDESMSENARTLEQP